jgi:hypothetical protein
VVRKGEGWEKWEGRGVGKVGEGEKVGGLQ